VPLLTYRISVVIVSIGAARIYRGLVEHAASRHHVVQTPFKCCDEQHPETEEAKDGHIV
jgi:hypothetical protein